VPSRITRFNDFGAADLMVESVEDLNVTLLRELVDRAAGPGSPVA
jgi:hypothetical protein